MEYLFHNESGEPMPALDVITLGRASVDLYGTQVGGRLEDMGSFQKYIGGSPTNIACGAARLGLRSAVITGVGDEHMGRFITEELARNGVSTRGVKVDPARLTALVILGIRDDRTFPLIFYRENCADMGLTPADIDEGLVADARALVVTGTHLSHPMTEAAVVRALDLARAHGLRTALDIDYRPNLWGVAGHGDGESRFVESAAVTARLQGHLHRFDLIVGTEEEFHIAGGVTDTMAALRAVRATTPAALVCKRGPMGAAAFAGAIPATLDQGESGPGCPIEVFNVLGAGDGFFAGLLKGWLDGERWPRALAYANACGAFAVSRHGCTPAYPSWEELRFFLTRGVVTPALRHDAALEQLHWSTTRRRRWTEVRAFAFDHRAQLQEIPGATPARIARFKELCLDATLAVADGRDGYGLLCDSRLGRSALHRAAGQGPDAKLWLARPVEWPASRPLRLEPEIGPDFGGLAEWPVDHIVKVLCFAHPDDAPEMQADQEATLTRLFAACRRNRLEMLLELIPSRVGPVADDTVARLIHRTYDAGIFPDWWKLEPMRTAAAWQATCDAIAARDPHVQGVVVLGLGQAEADLAAAFALAARQPLVKGFAVGRTIHGAAGRDWMAGRIDDAEAVAVMAESFRRLCGLWDAARGAA